MWWLLRIDLIVRSPLQLSYSRSMTSFWLLLLQASGSLPWTTAPPPQSQHQLRGTVLNKWNAIMSHVLNRWRQWLGGPGWCRLKGPLRWRPCRHLDPVSRRVCRIFKVRRSWSEKKLCERKDWRSVTQTLFFLVNFPHSTDWSLWGALSHVWLSSAEHPQVKLEAPH